MSVKSVMEITIALLLVTCRPTALQAQKSGVVKRIDSYITHVARADSFAGYVMIAKTGKPVYSKGFGKMRDGQIPGPDTRFMLGAVSSLFTGTAVVGLVQNGKVHFRDTIGTYIPGLPFGSDVTVQQLLTHSSGLPVEVAAADQYDRISSCTDLLPFLKSLSLGYNPGDSAAASEAGIILLGALIEKVTGMPYTQYISQSILKPAGMVHTAFTPYDQAGGTGPRSLRLPAMWSSASDLLQFDKMVFAYKLLDKEHTDLMTSRHTYSGWAGCYFGYVWFTGAHGGTGQQGNEGAYHAAYYHYASSGMTMIILANHPSADIRQLSGRIGEMLSGTR